MNENSVKQIVERCQRGEQEAFGQLYTLTYPKLRNVCRQYISNEDDIDDLLHDAYYLIFTKIDTLNDASKADFWMQKVVRNLALTDLQQRKQQPIVPLDHMKEAAVMPSTVESAETYEEIMTLIEQLPNSYRRVFRLSVLEGMSHKQIADLLNIESHTSSEQLSRAKKKLRRSLAILLLGLLAIGVPIGIWKSIQQPPSSIITPTEPQQSASAKPVIHQEVSNSSKSVRDTRPVKIEKLITEQTTVADSDLQQPITQEKESPQESIPQELNKHQEPIMTTQTPNVPDIPAYSTAQHNDWTLALDFSGISGRQTFNLPYGEYGMNDPEMDTITHHRLPLTIGLTVNKMLGNRWAVGTGLQYTQLYSETQAGNTYSWEQSRQRLHYLGIPLRATWYPARSSHWILYGSAQTMLELPLGSTLQQDAVVGGRQISTERLKLNPSVQWSVGLGIGLEYRISPVIGLYVEPSVHYYFKTDDGLDTYRTKHPATISIPIGIRIDIK